MPTKCKNPAGAWAWDDEDDKYNACPVRFIPNAVAQWDNQRRYENRHGAPMVKYRDRNSKFIEAEEEYDHWFEYWKDLLKPIGK